MLCQRISTSMSAEQASSGAMPHNFDGVPLQEIRNDLGRAMVLALKWGIGIVIEVVVPPHAHSR
jgi:hypothetical protein